MIVHWIIITYHPLFVGPAVEGFLLSLARDTQPVVAVVLDPADVVAVAEHLKHVNINNQPIWILGKSFLSMGAFTHAYKSSTEQTISP